MSDKLEFGTEGARPAANQIRLCEAPDVRSINSHIWQGKIAPNLWGKKDRRPSEGSEIFKGVQTGETAIFVARARG